MKKAFTAAVLASALATGGALAGATSANAFPGLPIPVTGKPQLAVGYCKSMANLNEWSKKATLRVVFYKVRGTNRAIPKKTQAIVPGKNSNIIRITNQTPGPRVYHYGQTLRYKVDWRTGWCTAYIGVPRV